MKRILIATTSKGKIKEFETYLTPLGYECISLNDIKNFTPPEETGKTFKENAIIKARYYSTLSDYLTVSEDSGIILKAFRDYPGIYSSRIGKDDEERISTILKKLYGIKNRFAKYVSVIALAKNGEIIKTFRGEVSGKIINEKRGTFGFGYDPIFYYHPLRKTFAEIPPEIKNKYSHRGRAIRKLVKFLKNIEQQGKRKSIKN